MINQSESFEGRENKILFYQKWMPEGDIKANFVAIHGWGSHSDRFKTLAEFLTEKGSAIYSFDLRGHWRNIGNYPGHIDSMDHIQKDLVLFMDLISRESKNKSIFLLGHSFGGLISLIYAINRLDLAGIIVSTPLLGLSEKINPGKKMVKNLSAKFTPEKTIPFTMDQKDLTSDLKILREFIADKNKLDVISAKSFIEMDKAMRWALENASKLVCPILIMQAGNDKIGDKSKTKEFFDKIKSQDKSYKEYDGFLHDLWNEKKRAQVYQDMYVWIQKHT